MDLYAFPVIGVPKLQVRSALRWIRNIALCDRAHRKRFRSKSDMSPAKAVGLMQVTPQAARDTAKRFGVYLRSGSGSCLTRSTIRRWALPNSPPYFKRLPRLIHLGFCRLQCGPRPGRAIG